MRLIPRFHSGHAPLVWTILGLFAAILLPSLLLAFFGPPYLPLWYSITVVEEQLAERIWVLALPLLAFFIGLGAVWFGRHTALEHERYVAALSLWSGIALLSLLLLALLRIVGVVL